jgi:hypothetical protein
MRHNFLSNQFLISLNQSPDATLLDRKVQFDRLTGFDELNVGELYFL